MKTLHDYESVAWIGINSQLAVVEAYAGTSIVQWYGNIERQLARMLEENEASRNFVYADKLRKYLQTWRENEITGSLNLDVIKILRAATEQLAVDSWSLGNYFSNLRDQLRKLLASEEQLPRIETEPPDNKAMGPGAGAPGGSMPPLNPEFGPEKEAPGETPENAGGEPPEGEEDELENANAQPPPRANA